MRALVTGPAVASAAFTIAACGSDSDSATTVEPESESSQPPAFAVPGDMEEVLGEFQECLTDQGIDLSELHRSGEAPDPELQAAFEACRHLLPEGGAGVPGLGGG